MIGNLSRTSSPLRATGPSAPPSSLVLMAIVMCSCFAFIRRDARRPAMNRRALGLSTRCSALPVPAPAAADSGRRSVSTRSRFTVWEGFSLALVPGRLRRYANSPKPPGTACIIAVGRHAASPPSSARCAPMASGSASAPVLVRFALSFAGHAGNRHRHLAARLLSVLFRFLHLQLGMHTVILAHVAFSIAYVVIVVMARLRTVDATLEEAALDLGANEWQAFRYVTLPAILPGVVAAALLAFTVSFDDYVITSLVAGVDSETLPMVIYAIARRGVNPVVNAISALIVFGFGALILFSVSAAREPRMNRRRYFLATAGLLAGCAPRSPSSPQRLQLVRLHRPRHRPQLRARVPLPRPLRHLRKQRRDARPRHERQLRLGHRVSHRLHRQAHARQRPAGPLNHDLLPNLVQPRASLPAAGLGSRPQLVGPLHGHRRRHRLQPQTDAAARPPGPISGTPACAAASPCSTIPSTSWAPASRSSACSINATDPAQLRAGPDPGHRSEAVPARLPQCRSSRPTRQRRRPGRADVEHHRPAGHGRLA